MLKQKKPVGLLVLPLLLVISILVYFGGIESVVVSGFGVITAGALLIFCPPKLSLGRSLHLGMGILLSTGLLSLLPQFYWPDPAWRTAAVDVFSIKLPFLLSIQPLKSWEGLVMLSAGLSWFYVLATLKMNVEGWRWFFSVLSLVMLGFAFFVIMGTVNHWAVFSVDLERGSSFVMERDIMANFLALGGLACASYGLRGLRNIQLVNIFSLLVSVVCVSALFISQMTAGIMLFFIGILVWFIVILIRTPRSKLKKYAFPVLLSSMVLWVVLPGGIIGRSITTITETTQYGVDMRIPVYLDCIELIAESPIAGIGFGNFSAIFPQYRIFSRSPDELNSPQSDLLWLLAEGGMVFFGGLLVCLFGFIQIFKEKKSGSNIRYRRIVFLCVCVFILHTIVATPAHHFGSIYFALLLAGLALPAESLKQSRVSSRRWRLVGYFLLLNGLSWIVGDVLQIGMHSQTIRRQAETQMLEDNPESSLEDANFVLEKALRSRPLDWRLHHERGKWQLSASGDIDEAMFDFKRAAFCEPVFSSVLFEEGLQWIEYDLNRTGVAWLNALYRESEDSIGMFQGMLKGAQGNPLMVDRIQMLSYFDTLYRREYLLSMEGAALLKEISNDFSDHPSLSFFSPEDRSAVVFHWLHYADVKDVEAFMERYGSDLPDAWYIQAQLLSRRADFIAALDLLVQNIERFEISTKEITDMDLVRLQRSYDMLPGDLTRGLELLEVYLANRDLKKALVLIESLIENDLKSPKIYYWRAEVLRQMGDFSDSWFAFIEYLNL